MDMHACRGSSHVAAYGYDRDSQAMQIRFVNGATYRYRRVPEEVFLAFLQARSKGQFLGKYIKGLYDYVVV